MTCKSRWYLNPGEAEGKHSMGISTQVERMLTTLMMAVKVPSELLNLDFDHRLDFVCSL